MKPLVYILYSSLLDKFYIGQSVGVEKRLAKHNQSFYNGAFTIRTSDWELFYLLECESRKQAIIIEAHIKKMKKRKYFYDLKVYNSNPPTSLSIEYKFQKRQLFEYILFR